MLELTKAEEQIMHALWKLDKAFIKDIMEIIPEPKPAYNTVATIIKIMEKKEFVSHKTYGNTYQYYPLVSRENYTKNFFKTFLDKYFNNSYEKLLSFMAKDNDISLSQIDDLLNSMEKIKNLKNTEQQ